MPNRVVQPIRRGPRVTPAWSRPLDGGDEVRVRSFSAGDEDADEPGAQ